MSSYDPKEARPSHRNHSSALASHTNPRRRSPHWRRFRIRPSRAVNFEQHYLPRGAGFRHVPAFSASENEMRQSCSEAIRLPLSRTSLAYTRPQALQSVRGPCFLSSVHMFAHKIEYDILTHGPSTPFGCRGGMAAEARLRLLRVFVTPLWRQNKNVIGHPGIPAAATAYLAFRCRSLFVSSPGSGSRQVWIGLCTGGLQHLSPISG